MSETTIQDVIDTYNQILDPYISFRNNSNGVNPYKDIEFPSFYDVAKSELEKEDISILELACGEGINTRDVTTNKFFKRYVAVDISSSLLEIAKQEQLKTNSKTNVEFQLQDCQSLNLKGEQFDLIFAFHLLHYATNKHELLNFCKSASKHCKKKFIFVNASPFGTTLQSKDFYQKYGYRKVFVKDEMDKELNKTVEKEYLNVIEEPMKIKLELLAKEDHSKVTATFYNYYWSKETLEDCLLKAGFNRVLFHEMKVNEELSDIYHDYLTSNMLSVIEAIKD
ncbi:hypothetical protein ABK040_009822 [Willaertia magna]